MEETKKYKLIKEDGRKGLYRIIAVKDIPNEYVMIKKGVQGGLVESEKNLSHKGNCWIDIDAVVTGDAIVCEDAFVTNSAISGDSTIYGCSRIYDSNIRGNCLVEDAEIISSKIIGDSNIIGNIHVDSCILEDCFIFTHNDLEMIHCDLKDIELEVSGKLEDATNKQKSLCEEILTKKKYRMEPGGNGLYRIVALRDIERHNVKKGQKGGLIENETNLLQEGDCWIDYDSNAIEDCLVCGDAFIENSDIADHATVGGNAKIYGSEIFDESIVMDAEIHASSIEGTSDISGNVYIDTSKTKDCKLSTKTGLLDIRFSELVGVEMNCPARILDAGSYDGE